MILYACFVLIGIILGVLLSSAILATGSYFGKNQATILFKNSQVRF